MKKLLLSVFCVVMISSCKTNQNESADAASDATTETGPLINDEDHLEAQKWLVMSIEDYFSKQQSDEIFTKMYSEYKMDATNVDLDVDGSLSNEQFHKKWEGTYNPKYAGIGAGMLISGQDWSKIKVKKCDYKGGKMSAKEHVPEYTFSVIIEDIDFKVEYIRDIIVLDYASTFFIDDVLEYN